MSEKIATKALGDALYEKFTEEGKNVTKGFCASAVKVLCQVIQDNLAEGNDVELAGVATIKNSIRGSRTGRNPATGAKIEIPEERTLKLSVAKALKDRWV